jgi:hypothetical protein
MLQTEFVSKIRRHHLRTLTFQKLYSLEIIWKNTVEAGRPQRTIWHMRIECWMPKATNTHSEYVMLIAFPLKLWLHERVSVSHYNTLPFFFYMSTEECICVKYCYRTGRTSKVQ